MISPGKHVAFPETRRMLDHRSANTSLYLYTVGDRFLGGGRSLGRSSSVINRPDVHRCNERGTTSFDAALFPERYNDSLGQRKLIPVARDLISGFKNDKDFAKLKKRKFRLDLGGRK